jgi:hypothetical protein
MVNILNGNNEVIYTINNGNIFQDDSKLFESKSRNIYIDSNELGGGFSTLDTGVIKSWSITISYSFVGNTLQSADDSTIATKGSDEQGDTGVIKSWSITINNAVFKIENSVNEQEEVLLVLLAMGIIPN